ncbi:hypothetical protein GP486_004085 [Trichoglossum hirsutum]|uniref:Major facilitator superfamily (MFS) profile domain-containing protein n=1 Tax=Trichoglossum hirsutum TaxID=265104 RepID=A0A9P8LBM7_9PEZI|nr:hypothetical protein GP486_004085 [Trichoglossum hirsutum]
MSSERATETSPLLRPGEDHLGSYTDSQDVVEAGEPCNISNGNGVQTNGSPVDNDDDEEQQQQVDDRSHEGLPEVRARLKYFMPAVAIGIFLSAMDQTVVVSSYGKIGSDLNALNNTSWIATASVIDTRLYLLTITSFQPLYGKLSDIFGRKHALLFAYAVFGTGCLFCGLARNMIELIAARAFSGIGGGGMTTVVSILLSDIIPLRERGKWQGYLNIIYATGSAIGAPLGSTLHTFEDSGFHRVEMVSPKSFIGGGCDLNVRHRAFLSQAPLTLVAFVSVYFILDLPKLDDSHWKDKLRRVDFAGAFVLVSAVFTLLLGLDTGSNISWAKPLAYGSLSASLCLFVVFVIVEMKMASEPFAPGHIIFERSLFACLLCNAFSFGGWIASIFYIPLFYQAVEGLSATQAGVRLLPAIAAGVSGSLFAGFLMQHTGRYYWLTVCAYFCLTAGVVPILLFTGLVSRSTLGISIGLVICGFSNGIGVTTTLIALIANAAIEDQAIATAGSYLFRSLGSVIGVSLSATVVQESLRTQLRGALKSGKEADEIVKHVRESLDYIKTLEPGIKEVVRNCYGKATRASFILSMFIAAGAAASSLFIREKKLSRQQLGRNRK